MRKWIFFLVLIMGLSIGVKGAEAGNKPLVTTTFYLWFPSPHNDIPNLNSPTTWIYDPPFMDGTNDESFWKRNLTDMVEAGVDGAFLLTYTTPNLVTFNRALGNKYKDEFSHQYVKLAVDTAVKHSIPIKFGIFVDYSKDESQLPDDVVLANMFTWNYTHDILPFFKIIPRERWLTHNGKLVSEGGRPVIMFWTIDPHIKPAVSSSHIQQIKDHFMSDFGIVPFILIDSETFSRLSNQNVVDGVYSWNSPIGGRRDDYNPLNGYRVSSLAMGDNEQLIRPNRCFVGHNPRWGMAYNESPRILLTEAEVKLRVSEGLRLWRWPGEWETNPSLAKGEVEEYRQNYGEEPDEAGFFRKNFRAIPGTPEMIFIQDFNELNEGTTWGRSINFPTKDNPIVTTCATGYPFGYNINITRQVYNSEDNHQYLPQDFYLKAVRSEIERKFSDPSCATPPLAPANVKTVCSGGKATISWEDWGGVVHDYPVRLFFKDASGNEIRRLFKPETGGFQIEKSLTVDINSGEKISGWIQSQKVCGKWSEGSADIPDCPPLITPTLTPTPTVPQNCIDTDGGKVYAVQGATCVGTRCSIDVCNSVGLVEYYCDNNQLKNETHDCGSDMKCNAGKCTNCWGITAGLSNQFNGMDIMGVISKDRFWTYDLNRAGGPAWVGSGHYKDFGKDNLMWGQMPAVGGMYAWQGDGITAGWVDNKRKQTGIISKDKLWTYDHASKTWKAGFIGDMKNDRGDNMWKNMPEVNIPNVGGRAAWESPGGITAVLSNQFDGHDILGIISKDKYWTYDFNKNGGPGWIGWGYFKDIKAGDPMWLMWGGMPVVGGQKAWEGAGITAGWVDNNRKITGISSKDRFWTYNYNDSSWKSGYYSDKLKPEAGANMWKSMPLVHEVVGDVGWRAWECPILATDPPRMSTPTPTPSFNPGDLNHDAKVDIFDYNILLQNFGNAACGNAADIDGNCKVDIFDFNILVQNFGFPL